MSDPSTIPRVSRKRKASEIRELLKGPIKEEDEQEEDEEELLLRELAKIKAEKAERKLDEKVDIFNAAKKSWRDDAVFSSSTRPQHSQTGKIVNDVLRSDFHRKFLDRYVGKCICCVTQEVVRISIL